MKLSNYPNGFTGGLLVRNMPVVDVNPGKVFYVGNNATLLEGEALAADNDLGGKGGTFLHPFATLSFAIGRCVAGRGDVIYLRPGYTEAVTATSTALNVAGVAIIGLGERDNRPVFNFGATDSNIAISGANCSLKNVVLCATIDQVVAGLTLSAAGISLDIESKDTAANKEFVSVIVTTASASNLQIIARHRGVTTGSHMTRYMDLVGNRDVSIEVDFYGIASTAVVSLRTTASKNVKIRGKFYNASVALTKNVTDTASSTWSVHGMDDLGAREFAGGDTVALAYTSFTPSTALGTDGTTVTDSATTVLGAIGANNADNAYVSTAIVANADGSVLEREEYIQTDMLGLPRSIASSNKTLTTGNVNMFTVTGGPIKVLELVGIVTTLVQAQTTSTKVTVTTTSPAATVDFSAAAVDLTGATVGSSIRHINTTGVLTVVAAGFVNEGNAFATNDTQYLVPAGSMQINNASASNTGAITWYMRYIPLSPLSRVA